MALAPLAPCFCCCVSCGFWSEPIFADAVGGAASGFSAGGRLAPAWALRECLPALTAQVTRALAVGPFQEPFRTCRGGTCQQTPAYYANDEQGPVLHALEHCVVSRDVEVYLECEEHHKESDIATFAGILIELLPAFFGLSLAFASACFASFIIMYVKPNDNGTSSIMTR